jgi:hypothetical protein
MTAAVYSLHVNDDVLIHGVPAVVQGAIIRNGERKIMVAVMRKNIHLLPPELQGEYHGGIWAMLYCSPNEIVRKENGHA